MRKKTTLSIVLTILLMIFAASVCRAAQITIGPLLLLPGPDTMTVLWETDTPAPGSVVCRTSSGAEIETASMGSDTHHEVKLTGLLPDTRYDYTVMVDGVKTYQSWFSTLPKDGRYRAIFMGDLRHNDGITAVLLKRMDTFHPNFIVLLGDFVGRSDRAQDWKEQVFDPGKKIFDHIPIFGVPGNHDVQYDPKFTMFRRFFIRPATASPDSLTFTETICGDLYIFLDIYSKRPFFAFTEGVNLVKTLKNASKNPDTRHIFVLSHEGVISYWRLRRGYSGLRPFTRIMKEYGVTALISGHDHHYIRGTTYSGLPFFITGGGGSSLYDINERNFYAAITGVSAVRKKTHHFLVMDVDGDTCTFTAVLPDGTAFDTAVLKRQR